MKRTKTAVVATVAWTCLLLTGGRAEAGNRPKYVFMFIGDGMANVQVHATEAYLAAADPNNGPDEDGRTRKAHKLALSKLKVQGMCTTYAQNRLITGSAAAATALACGKKTAINVIAKSPDGTRSYRTIAEEAKDRGMAVGIVSSVCIDHATPACYYAHVDTRKKYHEISLQLARKDFEYFAGGGMLGRLGEDGTDALAVARKCGFAFADTREDLGAIDADQRVLTWNRSLSDDQAMWYELDRRFFVEHSDDEIVRPTKHEREQMSLAEFTREGIRRLSSDPDGFFLMVEAGKIDWACHANDAKAAILDTVAFDDAVKEALAFYRKHPQDTLIVVTGDHECGGMTMGFALNGYDSAFEVLKHQIVSHKLFEMRILDRYRRTHTWRGPEDDIDHDLKKLLGIYFGLKWSGDPTDPMLLNDHQKAKLEQAFDRSMGQRRPGEPGSTAYEEDVLAYGKYDPLSVTITHIMNHKASISFTSYYHTGVPVMVLAQGLGEGAFAGFYDNTDVALRLAKVMGLELSN